MMFFEPHQYAPSCEGMRGSNCVSSIDNGSASSMKDDENSSSKMNEDIQLTADIVNDVLECMCFPNYCCPLFYHKYFN